MCGRSWWNVVAFGGLTLLVLAGAGLFGPFETPGDRLGFLRIQTPEITGEARVSEQFGMYEPSLTAIQIHAARVGTPRGNVLLELRAIRGESMLTVRSAVVPAVDLVREGTYRFEFAPIPDSRGTVYHLDVSSSPDTPSGGVALWATRGERLKDASVLVNGDRRFADLAFQTEVVAPTPRPRVEVWLAIGALCISWLAVVSVVREMGRV